MTIKDPYAVDYSQGNSEPEDMPLWLKSIKQWWKDLTEPDDEKFQQVFDEAERQAQERRKSQQVFIENLQSLPSRLHEVPETISKWPSDIANWFQETAKQAEEMPTWQKVLSSGVPITNPLLWKIAGDIGQPIQKTTETVISATPLFGKDIRPLDTNIEAINPKVEGVLGDIGITKRGLAGIIGDPTNLIGAGGFGSIPKGAKAINATEIASRIAKASKPVDEVVKLLQEGIPRNAIYEVLTTKAKGAKTFATDIADDILKTAEDFVANLKGKSPVTENLFHAQQESPKGTLPKQPVGEGELRESEHFRKVNERLQGELGENPLYEKVNLQDQSARAINYVRNNMDDALAVLKGDKAAPEGLLENSIGVAYEEEMLKLGDINKYTDAVNAISLRSTRMGQEIAALKGAVNENSPTHFIKRVISQRMDDAGNKLPRSPKGTADTPKARVTNYIRDEAKKLKAQSGTDKPISEFEDIISKKLGVQITNEEAKNITKYAKELEEEAKTLDPDFGIESVDYWIKRKKLEDYINSLIPSRNLKVLTSTIGRGTMLFSVKSPILNIVSNTVQGGLTALERRVASRAYRGLNGDFALKYIKKVNEIYQKTGYDISRMDREWVRQMRLGEEVTHSQGKGIIRKVGRFYEDVVFKQLMGAPDTFFSSAAFADTADILSTKIALAEGLTGDTAKARALQIFKEAVGINPTEGTAGALVRAQAIADARFATFTDKSRYSDVAMGIRNLLNKASGDLRVGDQLMPFVKTPAQVVSATLDAAGIGLAKGVYKGIKAFKAQDKVLMNEAVRDAIRGGFGLTLATAIAYTVNPEDFVGDYDLLSPKEKQLTSAMNAPYNSIKIGDRWVSLDYLGPLAAPVIGILYGRKYGKDFPSTMWAFSRGAGSQLFRMPGFTEVKDLLTNVMTNAQSGDTTKIGKGLVDDAIGFISSRVIPGIVSDAARAIDSTERATRNNVFDQFINKIPVWRQTLPEKINQITGETVKTEHPLSTILFGTRVKTPVDNAVVAEVSRLFQEGAAPAITDIAASSQNVRKLKEKISEAQFNDMLKFYGTYYGKRATTLITSSQYKKMDDEERMKALNNIRDDAIEISVLKYTPNPTAEQKKRLLKLQAKEALTPYFEVEDKVWDSLESLYPGIRDEYKEYSKLENSTDRNDRVTAIKWLRRHPQVLKARRDIALAKIKLRLSNPQIRVAYKIYYGG